MRPRRLMDLRGSGETRGPLLLIPLCWIVAVCVIDVLTPPDIHLGPLLVAAPAITAAFAGPRLTSLIGALSVAGQVAIGVVRGTLTTANLGAQIAALAFVAALIAGFCLVRDRSEGKLAHSRSVAAVAQRVLLQPLPESSGPLRMASLYLPAEDGAEMGGDLYAAARTESGTRLVIGDVRGKGLPAYNQAALLLGAFRSAAHRQATLPRLAVHVDGAMRWDSAQWKGRAEADTEESFATAVLLDIPDHEHTVHAVHCGHPPPLLLRDGRATPVEARRPGLPVGLGGLGGLGGLAGTDSYGVETCAFGPGDTLLLYTDGVTEARDSKGAFYPLAERAAAWTAHSPVELLERLREDLHVHTDGRLGDDAAAVAVRREPEGRLPGAPPRPPRSKEHLR